jgi:hypothetical protein
VLTEPQSIAEFKELILRIIGDPDPLALSAIDEVCDALERVYNGEQASLTPSQQLIGRSFFNAIQEALEYED